MTVHGYITRQGGLLTAQFERGVWLRCPRHHSPLRRVVSLSAWSPHYACPHCPEIYLLMGHDLVRCETPGLCVAQPLHFMRFRPDLRPPVVAGPLSRGLL